jgi:hypothetical protein
MSLDALSGDHPCVIDRSYPDELPNYDPSDDVRDSLDGTTSGQ